MVLMIVIQGMMRARGEFLLMVDADGATKASELGVLLENLQQNVANGHGIAVGSRAHLQEEAVAQVCDVVNTPFKLHMFRGLL